MGFPWLAAATIGGSIGSALIGKKSAERSMDTNIEAMRNRHTWEVEDLKRAGLNPILSAGGGGTAGMPGAQFTPPDMGATLLGAVNAATGIKQMQADVPLKNANQKLTEAKETLTRNLIPGAEAVAELAKQARDLIKATTALFGKDQAGYEETIDESKETLAEIGTKLGSMVASGKIATENTIGEATKTISKIKRFLTDRNYRNEIAKSYKYRSKN